MKKKGKGKTPKTRLYQPIPECLWQHYITFPSWWSLFQAEAPELDLGSLLCSLWGPHLLLRGLSPLHPGSCQWQRIRITIPKKPTTILSQTTGYLTAVSYPLWPMRMTRSSSPYLFLIHLMPCSCGSTMSGQRWQEVRMVAFSVDILSAGSPSFCHAATSASSVSMARGSRSGVEGIGTLQVKQTLALLWQGASVHLVLYTFKVCNWGNKNNKRQTETIASDGQKYHDTKFLKVQWVIFGQIYYFYIGKCLIYCP